MSQNRSRTETQTEEKLPPFYPGSRIPYTCPRCKAGGLLLAEDTLKYVPTPATREGDEGGYLDPWDGETRFSCLLQCSNPHCEEIVLCGGTHHLTEDWSTGHQNYVPVCYPVIMQPLDAGRDLGAVIEDEESIELDPTDENILLLLDENPERLITSSIARKLGQTGVGKNLSKLHKADLIENKSRKGYRITSSGRAAAKNVREARES